ncbi:hypothetical protein E8E11_011710 [Didymella keratinophila]|nr:hypothetical protein E8E11_011710 [Didymella keratinophila]
MFLRKVTCLAHLAATVAAHFVVPNDDQNMSGIVVNGIPSSVREKYVRLVNEALYKQSGPCPFAAYGTIIVNHTSDEIVCRGANFRTGDPTIHGEISAINACTAVLAARNMTASQISAAWADLSIYKRRIMPHLHQRNPLGRVQRHNYNAGWGVITMSSYDVFQQTRQLPGYQTVMLGHILTNETDPLFSWQYNGSALCPNGCAKEMSKKRGYLTCVDPGAK